MRLGDSMAACPWREEMHNQLQRDPNGFIALADERVSLTLAQVQQSASWVAREIWKVRGADRRKLK